MGLLPGRRGGKFVWIAALLYGALCFPASAAPLENETVAQTKPFVALILPTKSRQLKGAAETVMAGVLAQEKLAGGDAPRVRLFETGDQDSEAADQFIKAWEAGAVAVIGPLTRGALTDMANNVSRFPVPVLALNQFDDMMPRRPNLYSLSLSIENEAEQVARLMREEGVRNPVLVMTESGSEATLSRRMAQGLRAGWGQDLPAFIWHGARQDGAGLARKLSAYDAVFLAVDARLASQIRPYLGNGRVVYATSQIDPGRQSKVLLVDLDGVRYLETPWLAEPETSGFDAYERVRSSSNDVERLFALGADAWRVATALARGLTLRDEPGISGTLTLGDDQVIRRTLMPRTLTTRVAPTPTPVPLLELSPAEITNPFSRP